MSDVFISHVEEDADVALEIAGGLNAAGYTTWCYEEETEPGVSYLKQIGEAIEACQAAVLVISPQSLGSDQVTREVEFSHELRKAFVPVLHRISHVEFQKRRASWRVALGTAATIPIPAGGVSAILPRIVRGLQGLGVKPTERERVEAYPHNLEAERAVLGAILVDHLALPIALGLIGKDDFFSDSHRIIFESMVGLADRGQGIELVAVCDELGRLGLLERVGGARYLASLMDGVPIGATASVAVCAQIVKDKSTLRSVITKRQHDTRGG